jgi:dienelactone hydrolase
MPMNLPPALLLAAWLAAIPSEDLRNKQIAHTKTHFRMPEYASLEQWQARRAELKRQILAAAGLWPLPPRVPLEARRAGRLERGRWAVEKVLIQTLPGYYLAGNLYLPAGRKGPFPGVLIPHGHWKHGRLEDLESYSVPRLGANLAAQGYVAFAYDMAGYNDTRQTPHEFGESAAEQLWSFHSLGLQLWNSMRALDFLASLAEVDPARLAATGASGGGTQTFLLAAVDERVKVSAPVNMVSAVMQGGCLCENAPGLRVGTNNVEIAALAAPRPMLLVAATGDWTRNTPREEFPGISRIYRLYGQASKFAAVQFEAEHNYDRRSREAVYWFLRRYLQPGPNSAPVVETETPALEPEQLLLRPEISVPADAVNYDELFAWWRENARRQSRAMSEAELRERLAATIGARPPERVEALVDGEFILLGGGQGERIPGLWLPGPGAEAVLVVHPDGSAAARKTPRVERLVREGASVLLLDVFQTGAAQAERDRTHRYFLTFNRSDDALRVQDILTGLAFLEMRRPKRLRLVGLEQAGVWALFAAALAPNRPVLEADLSRFEGDDEDFRKLFFVPGIQRAGGLEAALRLLDSPPASQALPSGW